MIGKMEETAKMIELYKNELYRWNKWKNLTHVPQDETAWKKIIEESKRASSMINNSDTILDIGTGAGIPGIILSIYGNTDTILCEKDFKKCIFLHEIKVRLGLKYMILNCDIYKVDRKALQGEIVAVSKAFARLKTLIEIMDKLQLKRGIYLKGEKYRDEIQEAESEYRFKYNVCSSITGDKGVIIEISEVERQ